MSITIRRSTVNSVRRRFIGLESLEFHHFRRFVQTNSKAKGKDLLPSHRQNLGGVKKQKMEQFVWVTNSVLWAHLASLQAIFTWITCKGRKRKNVFASVTKPDPGVLRLASRRRRVGRLVAFWDVRISLPNPTAWAS